MAYLDELTKVALATLAPALELRAGIPIGIGLKVPWILVFVTAVIVNVILGILVFIFLDKFSNALMRYKFFRKPYHKIVIRTQKRIKHNVEKYGKWAVAAFIAIPLPGSGSYTGALAAHLIGLSYSKFFISNLIGVSIAGVIVTLISLGLFSLF